MLPPDVIAAASDRKAQPVPNPFRIIRLFLLRLLNRPRRRRCLATNTAEAYRRTAQSIASAEPNDGDAEDSFSCSEVRTASKRILKLVGCLGPPLLPWWLPPEGARAGLWRTADVHAPSNLAERPACPYRIGEDGESGCVKEPGYLDGTVGAHTYVNPVRDELGPVGFVPLREVNEPLVPGANKGPLLFGIMGIVWSVDEQVHGCQELARVVITGEQ